MPSNEWPIKSARNLADTAREGISMLQNKAFVAALTRAKAEKQEPPQKQNPIQAERRPPAGSAKQNLVDVKQFNVLSRLVKTVAWIWRAAKKFIKPSQSVESEKWEAVSSSGVISVKEREDAQQDILLSAQAGVSFSNTTTDRLVVYRDNISGLLLCGGRFQGFKEDKRGVPILPYDSWYRCC